MFWPIYRRSLTVSTGCVFVCNGILLSTEASINSQIALVKRDDKYYVDVYGGSGRMLNTTGLGREYFIWCRNFNDTVLLVLCGILCVENDTLNTELTRLQNSCIVNFATNVFRQENVNKCSTVQPESSFLIAADNFAVRDPYDKVLSCLGFKVG